MWKLNILTPKRYILGTKHIYEERHPKQWQTGYSPWPPTSSDQNQTLHGGWPAVWSKSVKGLRCCVGSKMALPHYFGQWLIQQLVLPYKPWCVGCYIPGSCHTGKGKGTYTWYSASLWNITSEALMYGMCSQGISQFYRHTHTFNPQSEWAIPALALPAIAGTHLPTPDGWKAELAWVAGYTVSETVCLCPATLP